jgi:hypothetical protein
VGFQDSSRNLRDKALTDVSPGYQETDYPSAVLT